MKLKKGLVIKIIKNEANVGLNPIGRFSNWTYVLYKNDWYRCHVIIEGSKVRLTQIYKQMPGSNRMSGVLEGFELESKENKLKINYLKYLLNMHTLNKSLFQLKKWFSSNNKKISVFACTSILGLAYYLINYYTNNYLMELIANDLLAQTIFMFLALAGFINIFFPFTLRDELSKSDAGYIAAKTFEKKKEEDETNARIEELSTF